MCELLWGKEISITTFREIKRMHWPAQKSKAWDLQKRATHRFGYHTAFVLKEGAIMKK